MKILHAIFSFSVGGAETMLVDIINEQIKTNEVSLIIINNKVDMQLLSTLDKRVDIFCVNRKIGNKWSLVSTFRKVNSYVRKIKPDVIHCHNNNLFPFFLFYKNRTCITIHNVNLPTKYLKYFTQVYSISKSVQEDIQRRVGLEPVIVYNGIRIDDYGKKEEKIIPSPIRIVQVGRLFSLQKGQDIAIRAIRLIKDRYPELNIELHFIGEGCDYEMLNQLVSENHLQSQVFFLGKKDRQWIADNLYHYDLLIQPSRYEGFGLTVIEGLAAGLPVVASDLDGPREILNKLNVGLLTKPESPEDLAEKIMQVIESYQDGSLAERRYLLESSESLSVFDIKTTAQNYLKQYKTYFFVV